ncbi:Peptidase family M23 [Corynebacterium capitovis DSM 44611]|nr:Peptidase family M23 [Corynebacterium capitovis DSM 44611]
MEPGAEVRSSGPGVVAFAGTVAGVPAVSIDHPGGIRTTYQPVHPRVETGTIVEEGQVIGMLGHSPEHDGLHWGARTGPDSYINPLTLLAAPTIRLKPVGAAR